MKKQCVTEKTTDGRISSRMDGLRSSLQNSMSCLTASQPNDIFPLFGGVAQ
jgi:hypothetical protein